jgi:hypothetical protein
MAAIVAASRCSQRIPGRALGAAAADDLLAGDDQVQAEGMFGLGGGGQPCRSASFLLVDFEIEALDPPTTGWRK